MKRQMPKTKPKKPLLIPFDSQGDMMRYAGCSDPQWRKNYAFVDTLKFHYAERGRSAATFYWTDSKGVAYPMFWAVFLKLMPDLDLVRGCIPARKWTFKKQGANYSIIPYEEME